MSAKTTQKGQKRQTNGKTTIRERLQKAIRQLVLLSIVSLVIVSMIMNLSGTLSRLKADMQEIAKLSADRIRQELMVSETIVSELGCSYQLSAAVFTPAQKQEYINQRVEAYGMVRGKLIGSNGICAADGTDYNDREYFKRSMQGEVVVSDPVIAKTDGKISVIISAPVYEGGDKNGEIIGVVFVVPDPEFLNDICAAISFSEHSGCYLLGSTGTTIAHSDSAIAQEQKNNMELSQTDSSLKGIAKIEQKMLNGETGYGTYFRKGAYTLQAYAPIEGTNGWMVAVDAPVTDSLMGKGAFDGTDERYVGMLGMHGTKTANLSVSECDTLVVVGSRFSDRVAADTKSFAKNAKIIQIDIDEAEINKNVEVDLSIIGDIKSVLDIFNSRLEQLYHKEWLSKVLARKHIV